MFPDMWISFLVDTGKKIGPLDIDLKGRIRVEQLDVALRLAPFTVLVSIGVVQVIVCLFWPTSSHVYLGTLDSSLLALAGVALERCWRWRSRPKPAEVSARFDFQVVAAANLYGLLLASIPIMLFPDANAPLRLLISSTCAGLIATGMSVCVMPRAAIGYAAPIIVGSFVALAMTGEIFYINVGILLAFYAAFIIFTIIHMSRLLTVRVMAQADLEREQEFTNLLLNDFEESASDWLWETDASLRLQHVSPRLIEVAGSSERNLQDLPLEKLFLPPLAAHADHPGRSLWRQIMQRRAFSNIVLPVNIAGEERYWSLSGKPISDRIGAFAGYRGVGSDVTEKKRSEDRLSYLAMHDSLTELPNRHSFQQGLDSAIARLEYGERFAILYFDLDEFKSVNDTFGHGVGDALLKVVAQRLKLLVSEGDLLSRLAGDEFAILIRGSSAREKSSIETLAAKIVDSIGAPYHLDGIRINIGASIGIAVAPEDGAKEVMRRADLALYRVKREGRSGYRFYEAEMDERVEASRKILADLRGALDRREFLLYFQPLVAAKDGRIEAFEALLRWNHPTRGFVSSSEFIPVAEESGIIIQLGEWIINEACRIAATWPAHLSVAVNLSAIQFRHSDLPMLVQSALRDSGLAADRLELEVTESVFLEATPSTHAMLKKLRSMQVRLSLDDFGTGYSSLSYLRRIAFDKLKIDQSFVRDLPHQEKDVAIVRAIVDLANSLGMKVAAEGVETEAQRACLLQQGCQQFQGYLFSKPLPSEEAKAFATKLRLAAGGRSYAA